MSSEELNRIARRYAELVRKNDRGQATHAELAEMTQLREQLRKVGR